MYLPDSSLLNGLSLHDAEMFGKPHVMAHETGAFSGAVDDGARCICGLQATNAHHLKPKGMGGGAREFNLRTPLGTFALKSALMAVCGMGNTSGCHGLIHAGDMTVSWAWDSDKDAEAWWSGKLLSRVGNMAHGAWLYDHGKWVAEIDGNTYENRGRGWR